ncbi:PEP-CTERM protein-sorting domain-containing protein [Microcystis aeruginosa]
MSLKTSLAVATTAIGLTILASPAQAAQFSFTYTYTGPDGGKPPNETLIVLSGILTGTATGNIVEIDGFSNLVYNGVDLPFSTLSGGVVDSYFSAPGNQATASFDGSVMDFVLFDEPGNDFVAFGLSGEPDFGLAFSSNLTGVPGDLVGNEVAFNPSNMNWQLQLIPEPGSVVALLGLGLGALASKVRKQG